MSDFARALVDPIPLHEAAAFFIDVKRFGPDGQEEHIKTAAVRFQSKAQQIIEDLRDGRMPEGKAGYFKTAEAKTDTELKEVGRQRGIASLSAEAQREKGRRGERGGEAIGRAAGAIGGALAGRRYIGGPIGTAAGLVGGLAVGGKAGKEIGTELDIRKNAAVEKTAIIGPLMDLRMLGIPSFGGYAIGKEIGAARAARGADKPETSVAGLVFIPGSFGYQKGKKKGYAQEMRRQERKEKKAALRFKYASMKLGFDSQAGAQMDSTPAMAEPQSAQVPPAAPVPQAPPPPPQQEVPPTMPPNYLEAEQAAQQAQEASEAEYFRNRLSQASSEMQSVTQQAQEAQQQVQSLQQQSDIAGQQVQQATAAATEANDRALVHSQEAANMRMAIQQLRDQMMQMASQDPAAIAQAKAREQSEAQQAVMQQAAEQQAAGQGQEQAQMGPGAPAASPAPGGGAPPGTAPAGAGQPAAATSPSAPAKPSSQNSQEKAQNQTKTSGVLGKKMVEALKKHGPYAAGGGLAGAGLGVLPGKRVPAYQAKAEKAEAAAEKGGYSKALDAAKAQHELREAEISGKYPGRAALSGALVGGSLTGIAGPAAAETTKKEWKRLLKNIRRVRGR